MSRERTEETVLTAEARSRNQWETRGEGLSGWPRASLLSPRVSRLNSAPCLRGENRDLRLLRLSTLSHVLFQPLHCARHGTVRIQERQHGPRRQVVAMSHIARWWKQVLTQELKPGGRAGDAAPIGCGDLIATACPEERRACPVRRLRWRRAAGQAPKPAQLCQAARPRVRVRRRQPVSGRTVRPARRRCANLD